MPYAAVVPLILVWLVIQFVRSPGVSARSKRWVAGATAATLVVPWLWARASFAAALVQFGLGAFLAVQMMVRSPGGPTANRDGPENPDRPPGGNR